MEGNEEDERRFERICYEYFGDDGHGCTLAVFLKLKEPKRSEYTAKVTRFTDNVWLEGKITEYDALRPVLPAPAASAPQSAMGMGGMAMGGMGMGGMGMGGWYGGNYPLGGIGGPPGLSIRSLAAAGAAGGTSDKGSNLFGQNDSSKKFRRQAHKRKYIVVHMYILFIYLLKLFICSFTRSCCDGR